MKNAQRLSRKLLLKHKIHKISSDEYLKILVMRTIGNFLVLSSVFMIAKTFYLPVKEEMRFFLDKKLGKQYQVIEKKSKNQELKLTQKGLLAKTLNFKQVEFLVPVDPNFSIVIPKIGANAKVLSNVDPSDERIYLEALKKGVAHAAGTSFPGEGSHIFLFAHSTDYFWNVGLYNAVFYLLYKLEKGDEIDLFYQGKRYVYQVIGKNIVNPSQVEYLTRKSNKEFLTLQTCWPPGTTLQRLLVFAVPKR